MFDRITKEELEAVSSSFAKKYDINLYSVSVYDGGELIDYVSSRANRSNNCYSVAKAFVSAAIGILESDGLLSVSDTVAKLLDGELTFDYDHAWDVVTVHDLLRHRAGLDRGFLDIDADSPEEYPSRDYLMMVLNRPLPFRHGEHERYSDAVYYVLSRIVTSVSGKKLDDYLLEKLFAPLDFSEFAMSKCPKGYPIGATGLYASSRDVCKLGALYAEGGVWRGERLLSEAWIDASCRYSYSFKLMKNSGFYAKGGMFGQMLMFSRDTRRAMAWHSCERKNDTRKFADEMANWLQKK